MIENTSILINIGEIVLGSLIIWKTAEVIFNRAIDTIESSRLTVAFLGVVILPLVTGIPNLFVCISSILREVPHLIYLNNIGNNIANLTLIAGLAGLATGSYSLADKNLVKRDALFLFISSLIVFFLLVDGLISRWDGFVLIFIYLFYILRFVEGEFFSVRDKDSGESSGERPILKMLLTVIVAGVIMYFSADLIVIGTKGLIASTPLSETFIGLIIVGMATAIPNGSVIIYSSYQAKQDLSFSNLTGDCVASIPLILGIMTVINPLEIGAGFASLLPFLPLAAGLFFLMIWSDVFQFGIASSEPDIKKAEAAVLVVYYLVIIYFSYSI